VPIKTPEQAARYADMEKRIRADQPARFSVALVSDAAKHITGQIFGVSGDNIILYSQPRPIETLGNPDGWTIDGILHEALPQMADKFYPLARLPLPAQPVKAS
jgi:hypothetical protein